MVTESQTKVIIEVIRRHPEVVLAYLFGSKANGGTGPLSDYDIAVYTKSLSAQKFVNVRLELAAELSKALQSDKIDLVLLNQTDKPALKYAIITTGRVLFETPPYRLLLEPKILNEYFDFQSLLKRHNLTKAESHA